MKKSILLSTLFLIIATTITIAPKAITDSLSDLRKELFTLEKKTKLLQENIKILTKNLPKTRSMTRPKEFKPQTILMVGSDPGENSIRTTYRKVLLDQTFYNTIFMSNEFVDPATATDEPMSSKKLESKDLSLNCLRFDFEPLFTKGLPASVHPKLQFNNKLNATLKNLKMQKNNLDWIMVDWSVAKFMRTEHLSMLLDYFKEEDNPHKRPLYIQGIRCARSGMKNFNTIDGFKTFASGYFKLDDNSPLEDWSFPCVLILNPFMEAPSEVPYFDTAFKTYLSSKNLKLEVITTEEGIPNEIQEAINPQFKVSETSPLYKITPK